MRQPILSRTLIHPTLRGAAGETARLCALLGLYGILIGLVALAALGIWIELPSAIVESQLVQVLPPGQTEIVKLRGSTL